MESRLASLTIVPLQYGQPDPRLTRLLGVACQACCASAAHRHQTRRLLLGISISAVTPDLSASSSTAIPGATAASDLSGATSFPEQYGQPCGCDLFVRWFTVVVYAWPLEHLHHASLLLP